MIFPMGLTWVGQGQNVELRLTNNKYIFARLGWISKKKSFFMLDQIDENQGPTQFFKFIWKAMGCINNLREEKIEAKERDGSGPIDKRIF